MKSIPTFVAAAILWFTTTSAVSAESPECRYGKVSGEWSRRCQNIVAESKTFKDHAWAGRYYVGDGHADNITIMLAPQSGWVQVNYGWPGTYGESQGDLIVTDRESLRLVSTDLSEREIVPITWGERHFLAWPKEMTFLVRVIDKGYLTMDRKYGSLQFVRTRDRDKPVSGAPIIPDAFQKDIISSTVLAEVTKIEDDRTLTLNVGRDDRVLPGVAFRVYEPEDACKDCRIRVVSVEDKTATAWIYPLSRDVTPEVGWKLTTELRAKVQDRDSP